jgi:glucose 1-dehydrogenase
VTVIPGSPGSARLDEVPEPGAELGSVLVEAIAVGVCGTDVEIAAGQYGWPPPGRERLILGHESLGRVIDPGTSGLQAGDHVVGIVRRPDPVPCPNCAVGEWDMCTNGRYTERGIKQVDGFMSERWRIDPDYFGQPDRGVLRIGKATERAHLRRVRQRAWARCDQGRADARPTWPDR